MLTWTRTANVNPAKFKEAMAWAHEVATYGKGKTGVEYKVEVARSGNYGRIRWVAQVESMAIYGQAMDKMKGDPKYFDLLEKAASLFMPGTTVDEFWETL